MLLLPNGHDVAGGDTGGGAPGPSVYPEVLLGVIIIFKAISCLSITVSSGAKAYPLF